MSRIATSPTLLLRGRYAPSPTGNLHLGNASTALLAWISVRFRGGTFILRMEDLDRPRIRPGAAERILDDLAWLGIDWDEGPDVGGPHEPYAQWVRRERYLDAFRELERIGRVYPCFCSRKDIAASASAPQALGDELRYPGTCRDLPSAEVAGRVAKREQHAWRFRVVKGDRSSFTDLVRGPWSGEEGSPGDFVVMRADGVPAYQLAVVVDDARMGITEVVRGDDLLASTSRQLLLYEALGLSPPAFGHVPLFLGTDGVRLSKRHRGSSVRELRGAGFRPEEVVGRLAWITGLASEPVPIAARELAGTASLAEVRVAPEGIVLDPGAWVRSRSGTTW